MKALDKSYQKLVSITSDPKTVFFALTQELSYWWGKMDRAVEKIGDVFIVSWDEAWYQFKVVEYLPFKEITWKCIDANQIIEGLDGVQKEWVGTQLVWKITAINDHEVELQFVHQGLIPNSICYDFCSTTWNHFIENKLKEYIECQKR